MNHQNHEIPFVWPDSRKLAGCPGPTPDIDALLAESQLVLGVVHGLTDAGVARLDTALTTKFAHKGNGEAAASLDRKIRLIVTLYPTCPTNTDTLMGLLRLQKAHSSLEIRLVTCEMLAGPENTLAFYKSPETIPTMLFGSAASMETQAHHPNHLTLGFLPEPILAAEWVKWFDVRWLTAARLTERRAMIPHLVLPEGTIEAAQKWEAYERLCDEEQPEEEIVEVSVDPITGDVSAKGADGKQVATLSTDNDLPKVSPVYRKLSQLLDKGHLVSVDKTTRLRPFAVPVTPKWFGLETLKQIGSVKRQVSYHISALTEEELKDLEDRRTKTSELLDLFSFSLADRQHWMPSAAEELFGVENARINTEAAGILSKLISGDLDKFMAERRKTVSEDANRMYRDLFPDGTLSKYALDEINFALKKRFQEAQERSFLPQLSFNRISLPQPQDAEWKSQLGSALHLLLSIVRYPRKACRTGFAQGMTAKPTQIIKVMDVLNDPFVKDFDRPDARGRAEAELEMVDAIEDADVPAEEKCEQLFELLEGGLTSGKQKLKVADYGRSLFGDDK